jgi:hypothetical protein
VVDIMFGGKEDCGGRCAGYGDRFGKKPKVNQIMQAGRLSQRKFPNFSYSAIYFLR